MKVYIVRERVDYHNNDLYDRTRVFTDPTKAMNTMAGMYESALDVLGQDPDSKSIFDIDGKSACFVSPKEDYYNIWIEECKVEE